MNAYTAMKDTGLIIAAGPLTIVRAMYTLSKEGGAITAQRIEGFFVNQTNDTF